LDGRATQAAGIWRDTAEWGAAYSMVMTEACEHVGPVHDRMPAILPRKDWADWLDGPPDAAGLLCRPYELEMRVERTEEAWVRRG
jgi:putative SOS response-associated peptidase YedK